MLATVKNTDGIDWSAKGGARVAQNVRNLINTRRYEVAFNRTMGISPELVDRPSPIALERMKVDIAETIARYEPRAKLESVVCSVNSAGEIEIEVVIRLA